jgi:hypothetical protein
MQMTNRAETCPYRHARHHQAGRKVSLGKAVLNSFWYASTGKTTALYIHSTQTTHSHSLLQKEYLQLAILQYQSIPYKATA